MTTTSHSYSSGLAGSVSSAMATTSYLTSTQSPSLKAQPPLRSQSAPRETKSASVPNMNKLAAMDTTQSNVFTKTSSSPQQGFQKVNNYNSNAGGLQPGSQMMGNFQSQGPQGGGQRGGNMNNRRPGVGGPNFQPQAGPPRGGPHMPNPGVKALQAQQRAELLQHAQSFLRNPTKEVAPQAKTAGQDKEMKPDDKKQASKTEEKKEGEKESGGDNATVSK